MGRGIFFHGANARLTAPKGDDGTVQDLFVFRNGKAVVSCWEFDADEIAEIVRTGKIYSCQLSGQSIHPMFIGSRERTRALVLDSGPTFAKEPLPEVAS